MKRFFIALLLLSLCACAVGCKRAPMRAEEPEPLPTDYKIEAELFPAERKLTVRTEIGYSAPEEGLKEIKLRVYANAYRQGNRILPDEKRADAYPRGEQSFGSAALTELRCDAGVEGSEESADGTTLTLRLARTLKRGERVKISLSQEIALANLKHRLGYCDGTFYLSDFYPMICPYRAGAYVVTEYADHGDPFCFENADFHVTFILPKSYECAASAKEEHRDYQGTFARFSYALSGARDFALIASETLRCKEGEAAGIPYRLYCSDARDQAKILEWTGQALSFFSEQFGAYPYPTFTLVFAPFFEAGVEHSGMGLVASSLSLADKKRTLIHEIVHQWWYGKVGNDQFADAWMDEGLAEYSVACFYKLNGKEGVYREIVAQAEDAYAIRLALKGSEGVRFDKPLSELSDGYYDRVYCGGLLLFCTLAEKFGFDAFNAALARYAEASAGKIATPNDLITSLSSSLKKDLSEVFACWLGGAVPVE